jgi:glutamyl-tRNA synthetase
MLKVFFGIFCLLISFMLVSALRPSIIRKIPGKLSTIGRFLSTSSDSATGQIRVRFAPSPTGSLHVGGARTALFNWLLAKKTNGKFIVRIEDTDEDRSTKASEDAILNDLRWLNLTWDEGPYIDGPYGPYRQSERKDIYHKAAQQLIDKGHAYRCFCTEEELEQKKIAIEAANAALQKDQPVDDTNALTEDAALSSGTSSGLLTRGQQSGGYDGTWRDADPAEIQARLDRGDPYTVRYRIPEHKIVSIDDRVRGRVTWDANAALLGDFIILRSNGMPVYNFCVAVDDAHMQITHVVRAEEHLSNTLRQLLVLESLGVSSPPVYAHCSLILGADRSKLSKRHGAASVLQFSQQGFLPEAMVNYLAKLGWNDGTDQEIYSPAELTSAFDLTKIVKSPAVFDMDKLRWINAQHIRKLAPEQAQALVRTQLLAAPLSIAAASISISPTDAASAPAAEVAAAAEAEAVVPGDTSASAKVILEPGAENHPHFPKFLQLAGAIAQRDMEVLTEAGRYIMNCLQYPLQQSLDSDPHVGEVLQSPALSGMITALKRDYHSGTMPTGLQEESFPERWKEYVKGLGKELGVKGKGLFHPLRLCLTGRMSGPDVGDQLQLLAHSTGIVQGASNTAAPADSAAVAVSKAGAVVPASTEAGLATIVTGAHAIVPLSDRLVILSKILVK